MFREELPKCLVLCRAFVQVLEKPELSPTRSVGYRPLRAAHSGWASLRPTNVSRAVDGDGPRKHVRRFLRLRARTLRVRR